MRALLVSLLLLALCAVVAFAKNEFVTCGSIIKLKHLNTGYRLHSHEIPYGNGAGASGQQSVTAHPGATDTGGYWQVMEAHGAPPCRGGERIANGSEIRLMHVATGRNLHSHRHTSPLSHQQEVSAYGSNGVGDAEDNWKLSILSGKAFWRRNEPVTLKHSGTNAYLHSHQFRYDIQIIRGQQEVTCFAQENSDNRWAAAEGIYMPPRDHAAEDLSFATAANKDEGADAAAAASAALDTDE